MNFFEEYPIFKDGRFFDRGFNIIGRISSDKRHIVEYYNCARIIGVIKEGRLYDETGINYLGKFENGVLRDIGGNIRGYYSAEYDFLEEINDSPRIVKKDTIWDWIIRIVLFLLIVVPGWLLLQECLKFLE